MSLELQTSAFLSYCTSRRLFLSASYKKQLIYLKSLPVFHFQQVYAMSSNHRLPSYSETQADIAAQEEQLVQTQQEFFLQLRQLAGTPANWAGSITQHIGRGTGYAVAYFNWAHRIGDQLGCGEFAVQASCFGAVAVTISILKYIISWGETLCWAGGGAILLMQARKLLIEALKHATPQEAVARENNYADNE
ncbi:MAG: hypothetical protein LQ342_007161 [Letrouitia transgressa]|nr:MAG: hypothetical protein LQ342_007161 [Letrouitia transgressa]